MTWTKLSDDYADDLWKLSDAAYRLHTDGMIWSNRKLLDSRIPRSDLPRLTPSAAGLDELLEVGFWKRDGDDAFLIVHHSLYQRTREEVIAQQTRNAANARSKGKTPRPTRERSSKDSDSLSQSLGESLSESSGERDGTGQDGANTSEHLENDEVAIQPTSDRSTFNEMQRAAMASWDALSPLKGDRCRVCSQPLWSPQSIADGVCGKTDSTHIRSRAGKVVNA